MVMADFRLEAALTLFLRMRAKEIVKPLGNRGRRSEWQGQIFDRKLLNSRFRACAVKIVL